MTFQLFKIFLSNVYSFSDFIDGFKKGPKGIFKNIFLILCFIYLIVVAGLLYVMFTINTYNSLEYIGMTGLFPGISLMLAFLIVFNFGIVSVGVSYYSGNGEEQLLSLPITPREFFCAKFYVSVADNSLIGIVLFAISSGYFGYRQGLLSNPLFYLGTLITAVVSSVVVISIIYFLFVVVLYFIPAFRKRSILNGISSVFIMIMALSIGFLSGETGTFISMEGGEDVTGGFVGTLSNKSAELTEQTGIFSFLGEGLKGSIIPLLVIALIGAVILFVFIPLLSRLYIKTFEGVYDVKQKKISKDKLEKVVNSETKRASIFKAMFIRDVRGVIREPAFFANGPMGGLLFPFIFILSISIPFVSQGENAHLGELFDSIRGIFENSNPEVLEKVNYFVCFGLIAFTLFCGNLISVASSSFSREGKGFATLKAMPISNEIIVKVKFLHAFAYVLCSCLITVLIFIAAVVFLRIPYPLMDIISIILIMIFVVSSVSALLIIIDMLFDTINPKLNWEVPSAAMKQNMNALFGMLVSICTVFLFGAAGIAFGVLLKPSYVYLVLIGIIFICISAIAGAAYFKYANKKIPVM